MIYKHKLLLKTLDDYENFRYVPRDLDFYWCGNMITWLWKWRKITEIEKNDLCDRLIEIMELHKGVY